MGPEELNSRCRAKFPREFACRSWMTDATVQDERSHHATDFKRRFGSAINLFVHVHCGDGRRSIGRSTESAASSTTADTITNSAIWPAEREHEIGDKIGIDGGNRSTSARPNNRQKSRPGKSLGCAACNTTCTGKDPQELGNGIGQDQDDTRRSVAQRIQQRL